MQKYTSYLLAGLFALASCKTTPPQITRFEGSPKIVRGDKGVLLWDVTPAKSLKNVVLKGIKDSLPIVGKAEVKPSKTQQYELSIQYKQKGKIVTESRTASIEVEEPKVSFTGGKRIDIGDNVLLSWELPHFAQEVRLSEWVDGAEVEDWLEMPSHATYRVKPVKDATYKLEYKDEGALKVLEQKVEVTPAFFTGTKKILAGEDVQLIWKTNPSMPHVSLEQRINSYTREVLKEHLPTEGSIKLNPTVTTEYLLSIVGEHQTSLIHKVDVVQGIINGQRLVKEGEKAFISWRVTPLAKKAWLEAVDEKTKETTVIKQTLPEEGQMELKPTASTRYVLAVETEDAGITRYEHTVRLVAPNENVVLTSAAVVRYDQAHNPQIHHKGFSSLDDSPITIEPSAVVETPTKINFDFSKADIPQDYKATLDALVAKLKKDPFSVAEITGHSDLKGTTKGCDKVAKERAQNIRKYLIEAGIPEYRIMTKSFGRMFPLHYQETDDALARENRRAEIVVLK